MSGPDIWICDKHGTHGVVGDEQFAPERCEGCVREAEEWTLAQAQQWVALEDERDEARAERDRLKALLRDRDELWCRALCGTLEAALIELVTRRFNELRPDRRALDGEGK